MRMLVRLVLGLVVLKAVVASPRFSRQVDLDSYDSANYDMDLENSNLENQDNYDYEDVLTIDDPQIEIGTLAPPDYDHPVPEASLEEQEAEEEEEEEVPLKPQLIPQGSGGSGVLMGPDTQKEVELHLAPIDILHVSGDFGGSVGSGASGTSGASGSGGSGDLVVSGASGGSGDIVLISRASEELLSSGGSGEFLVSGDLLISGDFLIPGDLSGSGDSIGSAASGASGDLGSGGISIELPLGSGGSGDQSGSGISGDLSISGDSGISGVSGDSGESGDSWITLLSGEEELPPIHEITPSEASGASGEFSGTSGTSGASGDIVASGDLASGASGASGTSGVSGSAEAEVTEVTLVPDIDKEEELLLTTTPQEGTGTSVEGSVSSELPEEPDEPDEPVVDWEGMPTCLLCTCLGGSVYCDDLKLDSVPPLPKDTTHFYARYNRITKINKSDFAFMNKLKRIDLTANEITSIDDKAFLGLPELEELVIRENHLSQLPALPETMSLIDASHNNIATKGIHKEAFKDMTSLLYLYLTDNHIDYIPVPLPASLRSLHLQRNNIQMMHEDTFCNLKDFNYIRNALEDIRLDGNPINLSRTPQAYICLPRIPIGDLI
ncbi:leucine-rich repeat protein soc-2 homolog [Micropterus salmoides]|uniref:leucine-rich repeat protein soc-2 homolog n=1 Tax=Micropterus salmoides TaxID=27706 RepID=UPI0018ED2C8F|nr:leucine-rich repeat protein soc-2 homolog [Micropterus salmoides]